MEITQFNKYTNQEIWSSLSEWARNFAENKWRFLAHQGQRNCFALRASLLSARQVSSQLQSSSSLQSIPLSVDNEFIDKCLEHSMQYYNYKARSWLEGWDWLPQHIDRPQPVLKLHIEKVDLDQFELGQLRKMHSSCSRWAFFPRF